MCDRFERWSSLVVVAGLFGIFIAGKDFEEMAETMTRTSDAMNPAVSGRTVSPGP